MAFATSTLSDIASPVIESAVSVNDSTAQRILVEAPKKTIEVYNPTGGSIVYYGDSTVTASTGIPILPGETKTFAAVENGFKVYLICDTSGSSTCRVVSYRGR